MSKATEYFKKGYNCSQAVFLTYADKFGINDEIALKLSSSFGGGMGRMREVCGAVTAMFAVLGLKYGYTSFNDDVAKRNHYALIQQVAKKFKDKHGSIICRDLLNDDEKISPIPSKRSDAFYEKRPCCEFIETVCEILDEKINLQ